MKAQHLNHQMVFSDGTFDYEIPEQYSFVLDDFLSYLNITKSDFPKIIASVKKLKQQEQFRQKHQSKFNLLTAKEQQIIALVVEGKTTKQIANLLFIAPYTVSTHRKNIKQKLKTHSLLDWKNYYDTYKYL